MLANEHVLNSLQLRHLQNQLSEQVSGPALLPWEVDLAVLLNSPRRWPHACMRENAACRAAQCLHMQRRLPHLAACCISNALPDCGKDVDLCNSLEACVAVPECHMQ